MFKVEGWSVDSNAIAKDKNNSNKDKKSKNNKKVHKEKQEQRKKYPNDNKFNKPFNNQAENRINKPFNKTERKEPKQEKVTEKIIERTFNKKNETSSSLPPSASNNAKLTPLQQKLFNKLKGSRFRWINEQLYTSTSSKALDLITAQPELFDEYHKGFREQVTTWPINPLDVMIKNLTSRTMNRNYNAPGGLPAIDRTCVVADMGCGEAELALQVNDFFQKNEKKLRGKKIDIHSFDLAKHNERITVADIKNVPMEDNSCCVVIFSLSLMGVNFLDFVKEAFRILKPNGELWIAEIKSRFKDQSLKEFVNIVEKLGLKHKLTKTLEEEGDLKEMFIRFEFFKPDERTIMEMEKRLAKRTKFIETKKDEDEDLDLKRERQSESEWLLKPCIYKRR
ncbi:hypothetical protein ACO0SA_004087 [Hanseniaspora valbyensis]